MPQASNEQRALMEKWFGDPINDDGPYCFLMSRGYTEKAGWIFKPTPSHTVSIEEGECIDFLCDEWDFGYHPMSYEPTEPPQQWYVCDQCGGEGMMPTGRMSHSVNSATLDPPFEITVRCGKCGGAGGWLVDAKGDT